MQFVLQHRYASAPQAAPVCARAGDAGSKNQAVSAIGQEPDAGNRKPSGGLASMRTGRETEGKEMMKGNCKKQGVCPDGTRLAIEFPALNYQTIRCQRIPAR